MTNHLAHTAREVYGWLGSSLPTHVSLIEQVAPKTDLRRLSDGCPIRSSKSEWDDNPKAGWVREVGIALSAIACVKLRISRSSFSFRERISPNLLDMLASEERN